MLQRVLAGINVYQDSNVLVGYEKADDAGVYRLDDERALVQTVDFFTPVVDDPFTYGQIAAANSLSDIYAMGGVPHFALSIVGFPSDSLEEEVLHKILRGGTEKMNEAQVAVIGGHSVQDPQVKFGYCVTGLVNPQKMYTNSTAKAGDILLLTKPLGTGIIATGIKFKKTPSDIGKRAIRWMLRLNAEAVDRMGKFRVHSVTDITGYGLVGHAYEMAQASGKTLFLNAGKVPVMEGTEELARKGMLPEGIESNRRYVGTAISWNGIPSLRQKILLDPQTSGGLLISLHKEDGKTLAEELEAEGFLGQQVGHVADLGPTYIQVE
ncbi:selenide, water dikinase SelD [Acidobacteria bacterium AH-259-G07]|nr:selenide, water dikinase SelD [Acidobacteria bacterium AH-259-G07]